MPVTATRKSLLTAHSPWPAAHGIPTCAEFVVGGQTWAVGPTPSPRWRLPFSCSSRMQMTDRDGQGVRRIRWLWNLIEVQ